MNETSEMIYVWIDSDQNVLRVMQSGGLLPAYTGMVFAELVVTLGSEGWHEVGRWNVQSKSGQWQIAFKRS